MKKFVIIIFLIIFYGCTIQQKLFINGQPVVDNVSYSYNSTTGISTQSVLIKRFKVYEDDESYISNEYYAPMKMYEFKKNKIKGIVYNIFVNNTNYYKISGKGFYYKLHKILRVLNDKNRTLLQQDKLIYKGHLSFKNFIFNLPIERGDVVSCYIEFRDKNDKLLFRTLKVKYKIT